MPSSNQQHSRGFTLIEILVSVSIVTLMVTIAYASFGAARDRSNDGNVREQLGAMRIEAEKIYKAERGTLNICDGIAATELDDELPSGTVLTCLNGPRGYAFEATLSDGSFFCTDSFGRANESETTLISGSGTCDGSGTDCDCN